MNQLNVKGKVLYISRNSGKNVKNWFRYDVNDKVYYADIIKVEFDKWIDENI